MAIAFMNNPATGKVALFEEAPGGGDPANVNALRNRPLIDPVNWLANLYFHSDFNYMEVSTGPTVVGVNHAAVGTSYNPGATINFGWGSAFANHALLAHGLGYAPLALVALGNNILWPGMPIQVAGDGGMRFATIYTDGAHVRLFEFGSTGSSALPAITLNYTVLVFRDPPAPSGNISIDFDPASGALQMGRGKFNSLRRYLQIRAGGSPFGLTYGGRTIDLANGAPRAYRPDGSYYEPVPSGLRLALGRQDVFGSNYPSSYGAAMSYNGGYGGPPGALQVQAP